MLDLIDRLKIRTNVFNELKKTVSKELKESKIVMSDQIENINKEI